MQRQIPGNVIGACFGLSAFAVALFSGLSVDRPAASILASATIALLICHVLGVIIARVVASAIQREASSTDAATRTSGAGAPADAARSGREAA